MARKVKGVPDGASVVIPRLVCGDPASAIAFCASTFGASGPSMFIRSNSPFWNASSRAWS